MNTSVERVVVTLDGNECFEIGLSIYHDLKDSIGRHYNHLQGNKDGEPIFNDSCRPKISRMHAFFSLSGHSHMIEQSRLDFVKLFAERRAERARL